jgi:hypothetical protein
MSATVTLTEKRAAAVAAFVRQRPGVTKHKMASAIFDVGLDAIQDEPERLDAALIAMVEAGEERRRERAGQGGGR